ncbi:MAG: hypothetical protein K2X48_05780 [Chitinophagaceae bacterium]|nr:hypothetical protein [Chitinophagaceae bacterium]
MQFTKSCLCILFLMCSFFAQAQSTYLPQQSKHIHFIDRLEIKTGAVSDLNFTVTKPYDRRFAVEFLGAKVDSMLGIKPLFYNTDTPLVLSKTDRYNLRSLYLNNQEWYKGDRAVFNSKKLFLKKLYPTPAGMIEKYGDDFFVVINPVFNYRQMFDASNSGQNLFINQRGLSVRGGIGNKVGFSASVMDVQERGPLFFQNVVKRYNAVPGANFYKSFKTTGVDYMDARGYFTFRAAKYINFQAGYDRNFIGNGYRSLFLSDFAGNNLFVKINTRIWKFNYQNLFMELQNGANNNSISNLIPKKYATMHHLSINLKPWLNIGVFESIIFARQNRFEFSYMNPIIFFRSIEGNLGSADNALVGADFKANLFKKVQAYGQLLIDEFNFKKLRADSSNWWGNKTGLQLGVKYIDVAEIKNLDLQLELNRVRPFTYSHFDSVSNYTHYNQPLAHPLGANFNEVIAIVRYQPMGKLNLMARLIYWKQGLDSANGRNFGSDIFRRNGDGRFREFGYPLLVGVKSTGINASFLASYEIKENIFIDANILLRRFTRGSDPAQTTTLFGLGVRMNLWTREYDY